MKANTDNLDDEGKRLVSKDENQVMYAQSINGIFEIEQVIYKIK